MHRVDVIQQQGWTMETIANLMESFIAEKGLAEELDAFFLDIARRENGLTEGESNDERT